MSLIAAQKRERGQLVKLEAAFPRSVRFRHLGTRGYIPGAVKDIPRSIRWSLMLFVFTFPFETMALGIMQGMLSLPKVCGLLFFGLYLFHYGPLSGKAFPPLSSATFWMSLYAMIFLLNGIFVDQLFLNEFFVRSFTVIQLVILFWIASDLLRNEALTTKLLLSYLGGTILLASGVILHLPGFNAELNEGRMSGLGDNPNEIAEHMAVALIMLTGLYLYTPHKRLLTKLLLLIAAAPLMVLMIATGSRGGVFAFIAGSGVYLMPHRRSKRMLSTLMIAVFAIGGVVYKVASNPYFAERWEQAYFEGSLSGREEIFPTAVGMILDRPLFGWHPVNWFYELGIRTGFPAGKDAHNLVLTLLLELGMIGAIPFLIGLWLCGRAAWKARRGHLGLLPLALVFTVLAAGVSGTTLTWKTQWLVLALSLAAAPLRNIAFATRPDVLSVRRRAVVNWRNRPY